MVKIACLLFLLGFVATNDFGAPTKLGISNLQVINNAASDIENTLVSGILAQEWGPDNAPQYNFQNLQIFSGSSVCREADVNSNAEASHFDMELVYADQTREKYRINQQYVFEGSPDFTHLSGNRTINYGKSDNHTLVITITD